MLNLKLLLIVNNIKNITILKKLEYKLEKPMQDTEKPIEDTSRKLAKS